MIRKFVTSLLLVLTVCLSAWADQQFNIDLGTKDGETTQIVATNGLARYVLKYDGKNDRNGRLKILLTVENISNNPIVTFNKEYDVKKIKKLEKEEKDKKKNIEFEKNVKGTTSGFSYQKQPMLILEAGDSITYNIDIKNSNDRQSIILPLYIVSLKTKRSWIFIKKQVYELSYPEIAQFDIQVARWSQDDPTYQATKAEVENFKKKLHTGMFCTHKRHKPKLASQQAPYKKDIDQLVANIDSILDVNRYMDEPRKCYEDLKKELRDINLNDYNTSDCRKHLIQPTPKHKTCAYCKYSESSIYNIMDKTYQKMHTGKITKAQAKNQVSGPYKCYTENENRKKSSTYQENINKYYNRIVK